MEGLKCFFGTFYGMSMDTCMREVNWSHGSSHCQSQEAHKRWCASLDFYFLSFHDAIPKLLYFQFGGGKINVWGSFALIILIL